MCDHRNVLYETVAGTRRTDTCPLRGCEVETFRQRCPRCGYTRTVLMTATSFEAGSWERRYDDGTEPLTRQVHAACLAAYKWFGWLPAPNQTLNLNIVHRQDPGAEAWRVELCGSQLEIDLPVAISRLSEFEALALALGRAEDLAIRLLGPIAAGEDAAALDVCLAGDRVDDDWTDVPF